MGILHAPTPGPVSPALFHGESQVPRNRISESSRESIETAPRQETVRPEGKMIYAGAQGCSKSGHSSHSPSHDRHSHPPAPPAALHTHMGPYRQPSRST